MSYTITERWLRDLPQQFQAQPRLEALISAIGHQLEEVEKAGDDILALSSIEKSSGYRLDLLGSKVAITRKEALRLFKDMDPKFDKMDDKRYRRAIKWKMLANTAENCTYAEIMESIRILFDTVDVVYEEPDDHPATIYLKYEDRSIDAEDITHGRVEPIHAAGVQILYTVLYSYLFYGVAYEKFIVDRMRLGMKQRLFPSPYENFYNSKYKYDGSINYGAPSTTYNPVQMRLSMSGGIVEQEDFTAGIKKKTEFYYNSKRKYDGTINYKFGETEEVI